MGEFVLVNFNEEFQFISKANDLGWDTLTLVYSPVDYKKITQSHRENLQKNSDATLFFGVCLHTPTQKIVIEQDDVKIGLGTSFDVVRNDLDYLYDNELEEQKDGIHQRRSGLNHVILKECKRKNVKVLFSYASLQRLPTLKRNIVLGRMQQNVILCKKEHVEINVVSFALSPVDLRHKKDVDTFKRVLCF